MKRKAHYKSITPRVNLRLMRLRRELLKNRNDSYNCNRITRIINRVKLSLKLLRGKLNGKVVDHAKL